MNTSKIESENEANIERIGPEPKPTPKLANWDYGNEALNSTTQQINRQKSARHLEILQFDPSEPRAVFYDHKRKRANMATLTVCDCNDFNRQTSSKIVKPCMHIYRLAIEIGLIEPKYFGWQAQFVIAAKLSREETERLQRLPLDPSQWGGWTSAIHDSGIQRNRQYRAYLIRDTEIEAINETSAHQRPCSWHIHGYKVMLDSCSCLDFLKRKLPCKHIYAAALASGIGLPLREADFDAALQQGLEMVFQFPPTISAGH
jgi:hypothetical protein